MVQKMDGWKTICTFIISVLQGIKIQMKLFRMFKFNKGLITQHWQEIQIKNKTKQGIQAHIIYSMFMWIWWITFNGLTKLWDYFIALSYSQLYCGEPNSVPWFMSEFLSLEMSWKFHMLFYLSETLNRHRQVYFFWIICWLQVGLADHGNGATDVLAQIGIRLAEGLRTFCSRYTCPMVNSWSSPGIRF